MQDPTIRRLIKTECGRAKYAELVARVGPAARLRLAWFVLIAALRDWHLPHQPSGSES
jgi:hypothetical protein